MRPSALSCRRSSPAAVLVLLASAMLGAGSRAAFADALDDLILDGAEVKLVADGFRFTEGPASDADGRVLFSDIPNSDVVQVLEEGGTKVIWDESGAANGLAFDAKGRLYACQGGARRVVRIDDLSRPDEVVVLAESYMGKRLNSPNDLALDAHGGVYFTDPRYGSEEGLEMDVFGVYYISADGALSRVHEKFSKPNGILVSPDGKTLYVAENAKGEIWRFPIEGPGTLGAGELFFDGDEATDGARGPDGMAHDAAGNIYATYKTIVVLDPAASILGRIAVPQQPANCGFGGAQHRTLYITARTGVYSLAMKARGQPLREPAADGATQTQTFQGLSLEIPVRWRRSESTARLRLGEFAAPSRTKDGESAEVAIFFFPGDVGGVEANVERWLEQFDPADRRGRRCEGKGRSGDYLWLDLRGTYNKPDGAPFRGKTKPTPGSRVINVMIRGDDGYYFLKLTGSEKVVAEVFDEFAATFGPAKPGKEKCVDIEGEL